MTHASTDTRSLQIALEEEAMNMGIARYREALAAKGDGETPAGQKLLRAALEPTIGAMKGWLAETAKGLASRNAGVFYFLDQYPAEVLAWATANATLSLLHGRPPLSKVATAIAASLEAYANMVAIEEAEPALAAKLARKVRTMGADNKKAVFIRKGGVLADVKVIAWDTSTRLRIGTLMLHLFMNATELVTLDVIPLSEHRTQQIVRPTEACRRWLEESHARCELLQPYRMPMVCRPRSWSGPRGGGYLTGRLREPIVKGRSKAYLESLAQHDMPWVYAAVNALQETTWAVNVNVKAIVQALWEASSTTAKLPSRIEEALPARTWAEGTDPAPEELHVWKVAAARAYEANAKAESRRLQLVQQLWVAEKMVDNGNRFHYVYNLDWRGRIYPVGANLNPQANDVAKGLLQFADGVRLGDEGAYWLAVHGANSYGVDKVSFEERIQWVEDHAEDILAAGRDPLASHWWREADSPFVFLAFCLEWTRLQDHVDLGASQADFLSHLPVGFDGSCNGLQNFSALLRDEVGGAATGLVPGAKPADIYSEVAKAAQRVIDSDASQGDAVAQRWVGKMTRKLAKRNTMTVPYGVTRRGMRDQLFAELVDSDAAHRSADANYLAACNYEAIGNVVVAARTAMDWLREAAKVAASTGLPVRWTAPSGFLAVQDYRDEVGNEVDFTVLGRRYRIMLSKEGEKLNARRQSAGISPNFIHSLDAAHLVRTVLFCTEDGIKDFAMVHDSYGCHAGAASKLRENLREAFVAQYELPVLEQFRDQLLDQLPEETKTELPPLPPFGTLDLEAVRQSEYFFA